MIKLGLTPKPLDSKPSAPFKQSPTSKRSLILKEETKSSERAGAFLAPKTLSCLPPRTFGLLGSLQGLLLRGHIFYLEAGEGRSLQPISPAGQPSAQGSCLLTLTAGERGLTVDKHNSGKPGREVKEAHSRQCLAGLPESQ